MINNIWYMPHVYKCHKKVADYLQHKGHLPLISVDAHYYYFAQNDELKKILESAPIWIKAMALIK